MALYAFDGTWNDSSVDESKRDTKEDTNVHRFCEHYMEEVAYIDGVGTRYGLVGKVIGGMTGAGWGARIKEQFKVLKEQFQKGDDCIDIIGYSRGAAIARIFVHYINENYDELKFEGNDLSSVPRIRFVGLFDTVASFGIPWSEKESGFDKRIPENVENVYHAMALDESRETFGIERCFGDRSKITEVWFRGGHGDIGGNATYDFRGEKVANNGRSVVSLKWMLSKARAVGVGIKDHAEPVNSNLAAPVTDKGGTKISVNNIGNVGSLSRRIHLGDFVHYTLEDTDLTHALNGQMLRRIDTATRIEDEELECCATPIEWLPSKALENFSDNELIEYSNPSISQLSSRRYPFDFPPARSWNSWFIRWKINDPGIDHAKRGQFWAPTEPDKALAWDIYVELQTRIAVQPLKNDEGDDLTALQSVYSLFPLSRESLRKHGVACANSGTLITVFLNEKIRPFTAKWHKISLLEDWCENKGVINKEFRTALKHVQPVLISLSEALADLIDARLE